MEPEYSLPYSQAPPPVPIVSQLHPVPTTPSHFLKINLNIILPSTSWSPQWSLSIRLTLCTTLLSSIRTTCPAYLNLIDFIKSTVLGEQYRSLSSSLCNFLHAPVTPSLLGPNILLNTLFIKQPQPMFLPQCQRPSFTSIQNNRQNYSSIYLDL